ncbi:MAG: 4Fe-4S dicluster domain-containing protein [bacterium]
MATRKIIRIDEELCDGCGDCVSACAEGAIEIVDGKAKLVGDIFCDGMGVCLGHCPTGALTIEKRDAGQYDEAAVQKRLSKLNRPAPPQMSQLPQAPPVSGGCPGAAMRNLSLAATTAAAAPSASTPLTQPSLLGHWPVQLMLVPPHAPFLKNADLLVCADCVPFTVPDFHSRYLAGRAVVVGCPKLDDLQHYFEKLKAMFIEAQPRRITVLKMEVPCCGGIAQAAMQARNEVTPQIPIEVHTIGVRGEINCEFLAPQSKAG